MEQIANNSRNTMNSTTMKQGGVVSLRELFTERRKKPMDLPNESYCIPKYSWRNPKFNCNNEKKLDYVSLFSERVKPDLNLIKIHPRRKTDVTAPGP